METTVLVEIERLRRAPLAALCQRYREVFGEDPRSRHREHLFRKIAWRLQSLQEGNLTERARARAQQIACDADLKTKAPRDFFGEDAPAGLTVPSTDRGDRRLPMVGTVITREFKGRKHLVEVLAGGFRYEGRQHKSLSAVAREITGSRWNGLVFFGFAASTPKLLGSREKANA